MKKRAQYTVKQVLDEVLFADEDSDYDPDVVDRTSISSELVSKAGLSVDTDMNDKTVFSLLCTTRKKRRENPQLFVIVRLSISAEKEITHQMYSYSNIISSIHYVSKCVEYGGCKSMYVR